MRRMKPQWIIFSEHYVKFNDHKAAYLAAYPKVKGESARVAGNLLLKKAHIINYIDLNRQDIRERYQAEQAKLRALEAEREKQADRLLTRHEKLALAYKIANGDISVKVQKRVFNKKKGEYEMVWFDEYPSISDRLKAIEIDNKMCGDYGLDKEREKELEQKDVETETKGPQMNSEEIIQAIAKMRAVK